MKISGSITITVWQHCRRQNPSNQPSNQPTLMFFSML